jgi:hypothetical protein
MVFNTTFNNISVTLLRLFLLVEETGRPGENHLPAVPQWILKLCDNNNNKIPDTLLEQFKNPIEKL